MQKYMLQGLVNGSITYGQVREVRLAGGYGLSNVGNNQLHGVHPNAGHMVFIYSQARRTGVTSPG